MLPGDPVPRVARRLANPGLEEGIPSAFKKRKIWVAEGWNPVLGFQPVFSASPVVVVIQNDR
jgi:hypothetical protein